MAKKSKKKAGSKAKTPKSSSSSSGGFVQKAGAKVSQVFSGKSKGAGKGRRRRGALWYAKEIQRLKLKKRYERIKYRV